jgi:hypothetical protein
MARRHCRSSLNRPDVVGCGREVAKRVNKTTSVLETKKKEELLMKLLDDPKIPTARRNPQKPHHFHKPLDVAADGVEPGETLLHETLSPPPERRPYKP